MWVPAISGVLLRLYGMGLQPNDLIWEQSTKMVMEIALREGLKIIYGNSKSIQGEKSPRKLLSEVV